MIVGSFHCTETHEIDGRGFVMCIDLIADGVRATYKEVNEWVGKEIIIDGELYTVRGVETFKPCEHLICGVAGILV